MDFLAILNSISTKDQASELISMLDTCLSIAFTTQNIQEKLKEILSHEYFILLKPLLSEKNWHEMMSQLREKLTQLPVITLYTPYRINQKIAETLCMYTREHVSPNVLVDVIQKNTDSLLSIEWKGHYGEF